MGACTGGFKFTLINLGAEAGRYSWFRASHHCGDIVDGSC